MKNLEKIEFIRESLSYESKRCTLLDTTYNNLMFRMCNALILEIKDKNREKSSILLTSYIVHNLLSKIYGLENTKYQPSKIYVDNYTSMTDFCKIMETGHSIGEYDVFEPSVLADISDRYNIKMLSQIKTIPGDFNLDNSIIMCDNSTELNFSTVKSELNSNGYTVIDGFHNEPKTSSDYIKYYKTDKILIRFAKNCFFNVKHQIIYLNLNGLFKTLVKRTNGKDLLGYVVYAMDSLNNQNMSDYSDYDFNELFSKTEQINSIILRTTVYKDIDNITQRRVQSLKSNAQTKIDSSKVAFENAISNFLKLDAYISRNNELNNIPGIITKTLDNLSEFMTIKDVSVQTTQIENSNVDGYYELTYTIDVKPLVQTFIFYEDLEKCKYNLAHQSNTLLELYNKILNNEADLVCAPMKIQIAFRPLAFISKNKYGDYISPLVVRFANYKSYKHEYSLTVNNHTQFYSTLSSNWFAGCLGGFDVKLSEANMMIEQNPEKYIKMYINLILNYLRTTSSNGDPAGAVTLRSAYFADKNGMLISRGTTKLKGITHYSKLKEGVIYREEGEIDAD